MKPWFLGLIPTPQSVIKRHPISTHRLWLIFTPLPNAGETPRAVNYRLLSLSSRDLPCCDSLQPMPSAALHCSPTTLTETGGIYPPNPAPFPFGATCNRRTRLGFTRLRLGMGRNGGNVLFSWSQINNTFNDPAKEMKTNQLSLWYQNKVLSRES